MFPPNLSPTASGQIPYSITSLCIIGSFDVQAITANSSAPNTMSLTATYVANSPATGVLFALLLSGSTSVDFGRSVYLALDRDLSSGLVLYVQDNLWGGPYTVVAYDIESDGTPGLGSIASAKNLNVTIAGESNRILQ